MVDSPKLFDLMELYLSECRLRNLSPRTIEGYHKLLRAFLLWVAEEAEVDRIKDLLPQHFKMYLLYKEHGGAKPQYINDILRCMRTFSHYLLDEGYTNRLYTEKIHNVRQPKVKIESFQEDEVKKMLGYYCKHSYLDVRNNTLMSILFDTGIRCNELITLSPSQFQKGSILIHGKGAKQRYVPLSPILQKLIQKYQLARSRYFAGKILMHDNLFLSKTGKPMTEEIIRRILREAAENVGVRDTIRVSPHTCRHTFAHTQLRNGCDVYTLSRLLGHESITVTQRYLEGIVDEQVLKVGLQHSPLMNMAKGPSTKCK